MRLLAGLVLGLCASTFSVQAAENQVNDFPTLERVEYVYGCMNSYGGENYNTLYACSCAIDKIAEKMSYEQFVSNKTLKVMIKTPGERGGPFRDATGGRKAVKAFDKFVSEMESSCGLKKPAKKK